jgi:hypothetical protein
MILREGGNMAEEAGTAKGFANPEAVVTITIGPDGQLSVDNDPITLSKGKGHRATWRLQGGAGTFTIIFGNSPFPTNQYNHNTAKSLAPHPDAMLGTYKYTVQVPGCNDLDPQVIVDP